MFSEELRKYDWDDVTTRIYAKTEVDVRRALIPGRRCDIEDFMALVSPAAEPFLETMARLSRLYRGAFRTYHFDVCTALHNQFLHQLLRILWLSCSQQNETDHSHRRGNR